MAHLFNHTSSDDMRISLQHVNPRTGFEIRECLEALNASLNDEIKHRNRISVIRQLQAKINKIKKQKPGDNA